MAIKFKNFFMLASVMVSILLLYANSDHSSSSTDSEHVPFSPSQLNDKQVHVPSSPNPEINHFQKRLDEQRLNPNIPAESTTVKHQEGHDPFKAFLDSQRLQLDQARVSPFDRLETSNHK